MMSMIPIARPALAPPLMPSELDGVDEAVALAADADDVDGCEKLPVAARRGTELAIVDEGTIDDGMLDVERVV